MVTPLALGASESPLGQSGWSINKLCIGSVEGSDATPAARVWCLPMSRSRYYSDLDVP